MDIVVEISGLVDGWCERRALRPLGILLPWWPPASGLTDEWQAVWAALRHVRAVCRDDLVEHGEAGAVGAVIAQLSGVLFPAQSAESLESIAERLAAAMFDELPGRTPGSMKK